MRYLHEPPPAWWGALHGRPRVAPKGSSFLRLLVSAGGPWFPGTGRPRGLTRSCCQAPAQADEAGKMIVRDRARAHLGLSRRRGAAAKLQWAVCRHSRVGLRQGATEEPRTCMAAYADEGWTPRASGLTSLQVMGEMTEEDPGRRPKRPRSPLEPSVPCVPSPAYARPDRRAAHPPPAPSCIELGSQQRICRRYFTGTCCTTTACTSPHVTRLYLVLLPTPTQRSTCQRDSAHRESGVHLTCSHLAIVCV